MMKAQVGYKLGLLLSEYPPKFWDRKVGCGIRCIGLNGETQASWKSRDKMTFNQAHTKFVSICDYPESKQHQSRRVFTTACHVLWEDSFFWMTPAAGT